MITDHSKHRLVNIMMLSVSRITNRSSTLIVKSMMMLAIAITNQSMTRVLKHITMLVYAITNRRITIQSQQAYFFLSSVRKKAKMEFWRLRHFFSLSAMRKVQNCEYYDGAGAGGHDGASSCQSGLLQALLHSADGNTKRGNQRRRFADSQSLIQNSSGPTYQRTKEVTKAQVSCLQETIFLSITHFKITQECDVTTFSKSKFQRKQFETMESKLS